jgi:hypothetical protein
LHGRRIAAVALDLVGVLLGTDDVCPLDTCPDDLCPLDTCPDDLCPLDTCPDALCPGGETSLIAASPAAKRASAPVSSDALSIGNKLFLFFSLSVHALWTFAHNFCRLHFRRFYVRKQSRAPVYPVRVKQASSDVALRGTRPRMRMGIMHAVYRLQTVLCIYRTYAS